MITPVRVHKASRISPDVPVRDLHIEAVEEIGEFNILMMQDAFMESEASRIEQALNNSLPGGTYDRVLKAMLQRKASHFRVAYDDPAFRAEKAQS